MSDGIDVELQAPGRVRLVGVLDFTTVPGLVSSDPLRGHANSGQIVVDLSGLKRANSAGLALLLQWRAEARTTGLQVRYQGIPASLMDLARACNVAGLIDDG